MLKTMLKNVVLPVGERIRGSTVLSNLERLEQSQWYSAARLSQLQEQKLGKLLDHAYETVPYYRRLFDERGLRPSDIASVQDLAKLPVLTKSEARRQFPDQMTSSVCQSEDYIQMHSSGSTGEPFEYLLSKEAHYVRLAAMFRFWRSAGYDFGEPWVRLSRFPHTSLSDRLYDSLMRCTYLQFYGASERTLLKRLAQIRRAEPVLIRGYASALYLVARTAREQGIGGIRPRAVVSMGSILFPYWRELIEAQFGCPVHDVYGGEGTMIAGQMECGSFHIHSEGAVVECLNPHGGPAHPGQLGSIVLTNLDNYAMPLIRYEIGDLGILSDVECSCGRGLPVMESVQGRDTDIVVTPDGRYLIGPLFLSLFRNANVAQFQVIQTDLDRIEIKVVKNSQFSDKDLENILGTIRAEGGSQLSIDLTFVDDIPVERSGKRRFVISEVGQRYFRGEGLGG